MNESTQNRDNADQNDQTHDVMGATKPGWMLDEIWDLILARTNAKFYELVEAARRGDTVARAVHNSPQGGCSELPWCVMGRAGEHMEYHAGAVTHLFGVDEPGKPGWWVSPSQDRDGEPELNFEGRFSWSTRAETFELPADQTAALLAATKDRASRKALEGLISQLFEDRS